MPKLIENAEQAILETARRQLFSGGYKSLTLRKVAAGCGIAVGTIYNYYDGKEMLVAGIMMQDWGEATAAMQAGCEAARTMEEGIRAVYDALDRFAQTFRPVWQEYGGETMPPGFAGRHGMLRGQITRPLAALAARLAAPQDAALAPLLAEMVLAAAMQPDIGYGPLAAMAQRIFIKPV